MNNFSQCQANSNQIEFTPMNINFSSQQLKSLNSEDLFDGARLIKINHAGSSYLLRITRAGKLILTK